MKLSTQCFGIAICNNIAYLLHLFRWLNTSMKDNSPQGKKHPLSNLKACSSLHNLLRSKYHEVLGLIAAMMAGYALIIIFQSLIRY